MIIKISKVNVTAENAAVIQIVLFIAYEKS
jgi:hypothetical protein